MSTPEQPTPAAAAAPAAAAPRPPTGFVPPQQPPRGATISTEAAKEMSRQELNRLQHEAYLRSKQGGGGKMAAGIAATAIVFFAFPLVFTAWKTSQGKDAMFRNKTTALPGTHSIPMVDFEREHGAWTKFGTATHESLAASLDRQQREVFREHPSGITPSEQYAMYKQHKEEVQKQQQKMAKMNNVGGGQDEAQQQLQMYLDNKKAIKEQQRQAALLAQTTADAAAAQKQQI